MTEASFQFRDECGEPQRFASVRVRFDDNGEIREYPCSDEGVVTVPDAAAFAGRSFQVQGVDRDDVRTAWGFRGLAGMFA